MVVVVWRNSSNGACHILAALGLVVVRMGLPERVVGVREDREKDGFVIVVLAMLLNPQLVRLGPLRGMRQRVDLAIGAVPDAHGSVDIVRNPWSNNRAGSVDTTNVLKRQQNSCGRIARSGIARITALVNEYSRHAIGELTSESKRATQLEGR